MDFANPGFFALKLKEFYWTATRALGWAEIHGNEKEILAEFWKKCYSLFYAFVAQILVHTGIRFLESPVVLECIGHLAVDFDSYLKDRLLLGSRIKPIFLCGDRKPANDTLFALWSRDILFVRNRRVDRLLRPFLDQPVIVDSLLVYCSAMRSASRTFDVQNRWADRPPLLRLSEAEIARGEERLHLLGIPQDAWFVCVHCREGGYSPAHEWVNSYRNSSIIDYTEAMRAIVARGGWCIRVGDPAMQPLEPMPGVIDYAHSPLKSDWMDVFLCARCRFFLGSSSGLFGVAGIFGKPSALANVAPLGCVYSFFSNDISIPKLLMDSQGRVISFPEAFSDEASEFRYSSEFAERGLTLVNNTSEEITELAIEMMDRLDGCLVNEQDDADLQARFLALIQPHHYSWSASSHIGRGFLRRHRALVAGAASYGSERLEKAC